MQIVTKPIKFNAIQLTEKNVAASVAWCALHSYALLSTGKPDGSRVMFLLQRYTGGPQTVVRFGDYIIESQVGLSVYPHDLFHERFDITEE